MVILNPNRSVQNFRLGSTALTCSTGVDLLIILFFSPFERATATAATAATAKTAKQTIMAFRFSLRLSLIASISPLILHSRLVWTSDAMIIRVAKPVKRKNPPAVKQRQPANKHRLTLSDPVTL